jgi:hypothetical protein
LVAQDKTWLIGSWPIHRMGSQAALAGVASAAAGDDNDARVGLRDARLASSERLGLRREPS